MKINDGLFFTRLQRKRTALWLLGWGVKKASNIEPGFLNQQQPRQCTGRRFKKPDSGEETTTTTQGIYENNGNTVE